LGLFFFHEIWLKFCASQRNTGREGKGREGKGSGWCFIGGNSFGFLGGVISTLWSSQLGFGMGQKNAKYISF